MKRFSKDIFTNTSVFVDRKLYMLVLYLVIFAAIKAQSAVLTFTDKATGQTTSGWTATSSGTKFLNVQSQDPTLLLNGKDSWQISYSLTINSSDFNQWGCPLFVLDHLDATRGSFTGSMQIWWQSATSSGNANQLFTKINSGTLNLIKNELSTNVLQHSANIILNVKISFSNLTVNNLNIEISVADKKYTYFSKLCDTELPVSAIQLGYASGWVVSGLTGNVTKADNSSSSTSGIFPEWVPTVTYSDAVNPNWQSAVPKVIFSDDNLIKLYNTAWKIAATRVRNGPSSLPVSPYIDESCYDANIWIWDSAFMSLFCRYAPNVFPGTQTLENIYYPIHKNANTGLKVWMPDNPPLLSWAEYDNYTFSGDTTHIKHIMDEENYLEKHFELFQSATKGTTYIGCAQAIARGQVRKNSSGVFATEGESTYSSNGELVGFTWTGGASGMDNTPRGRDAGGYNNIMWVDAIAEQAFNALNISRIYKSRGNTVKCDYWKLRYDSLKTTINNLYWDETDGFYYDVIRSTKAKSKVRTSSSFWVMMAEVAPADRAAKMIKYLRSDSQGFSDLGGKYPWVSLSRKDQDFDAITGNYWKGGIWMPLVYMGTKALEKYGYNNLADSLANNVLQLMLRTYMNGFECKNTIWECYSPSSDRPSNEYSVTCRPDFCGWSALGPTSMFIENILGFYKVDALNDSIFWRLKKENGTHGIENLRFKNTTTKIVFDQATEIVTVSTDKAYVLNINGKSFDIPVGNTSIDFKTTLNRMIFQQPNNLNIWSAGKKLIVKSLIITSIDVLSIDGKYLQTIEINRGENIIENLPKGVYLIKSNGERTKKIILN